MAAGRENRASEPDPKWKTGYCQALSSGYITTFASQSFLIFKWEVMITRTS